ADPGRSGPAAAGHTGNAPGCSDRTVTTSALTSPSRHVECDEMGVPAASAGHISSQSTSDAAANCGPYLPSQPASVNLLCRAGFDHRPATADRLGCLLAPQFRP